MREQIVWLARADTFSVDLLFGPVSDEFWDAYLKDMELCPEVNFYFANCIPASIRTRDKYDVPELVAMDTYCSDEFRAYGSEALEFKSTTWGAKMLARGYLEFGSAWNGSPYFLHLATGSVCRVLHTSFNCDGELQQSGPYEWNPVTLEFSPENLEALSELTFTSIQAFFQALFEQERVEALENLWLALEEDDIDQLRHIVYLGIGLESVNKEGLSLLEMARLLGRDEAVAFLERHCSA